MAELITIDKDALIRAIYSSTDASEVDARTIVDSVIAPPPAGAQQAISESPFGKFIEAHTATAAAQGAAQHASEYDNPTCEAEMERRTRKYWAEFDALAATPAPEAAPSAKEGEQ